MHFACCRATLRFSRYLTRVFKSVAVNSLLVVAKLGSVNSLYALPIYITLLKASCASCGEVLFVALESHSRYFSDSDYAPPATPERLCTHVK